MVLAVELTPLWRTCVRPRAGKCTFRSLRRSCEVDFSSRLKIYCFSWGQKVRLGKTL